MRTVEVQRRLRLKMASLVALLTLFALSSSSVVLGQTVSLSDIANT